MAVINLATDLTAGVNTSVGTAVTNNRVTIPIKWANLNGYPELVVETAVEDVAASYHPCRTVDCRGIEQPVKLRMGLEDGEDLITIDSIFSTTPFVRVLIYGSNVSAGTITYSVDLG